MFNRKIHYFNGLFNSKLSTYQAWYIPWQSPIESQSLVPLNFHKSHWIPLEVPLNQPWGLSVQQPGSSSSSSTGETQEILLRDMWNLELHKNPDFVEDTADQAKQVTWRLMVADLLGDSLYIYIYLYDIYIYDIYIYIFIWYIYINLIYRYT